jgi:hypothetical protein
MEEDGWYQQMSDGPREVAFCPDYTATLQIVQDQLSAVDRFAGTRSVCGHGRGRFFGLLALVQRRDGRAIFLWCSTPFLCRRKNRKIKNPAV